MNTVFLAVLLKQPTFRPIRSLMHFFGALCSRHHFCTRISLERSAFANQTRKMARFQPTSLAGTQNCILHKAAGNSKSGARRQPFPEPKERYTYLPRRAAARVLSLCSDALSLAGASCALLLGFAFVACTAARSASLGFRTPDPAWRKGG
jgi:hypothetical protein